MKPAPFDYHCPASLAEALQMVQRLEDVRVLAGGQSLIPMMNLRLVMPTNLVDLGRIPEIEGITRNGAGVRIGAMTTQRALERSAVVRDEYPLLQDALAHIGHQQTRNRGTLGGSLCHLDPAAELPLVAAILDANLEIASSKGVRTLPFKDFPAGLLTTVLKHDEILTHVELPRLPADTGWGFEEFSRRPADFAIVAAAAMLRLDAQGAVEEARLAIGGLGATPVRIEKAETLLKGSRWDEDLVNEAAILAAEQPADGDSDNTPEYRQHLAGVLTGRTLRAAYRRSRERNV